MRVECEQCKELTEAQVAVSATGTVQLTCGLCGHVMALPTASPTPPQSATPPQEPTKTPIQPPPGFSSRLASPATLRAMESAPRLQPNTTPTTDPIKTPTEIQIDPGTGAVRCPKCGYRQDDKTSCHRCGLALDRDEEVTSSWESLTPEQREHLDGFNSRWEALTACDFADEDARKDLLQYAAAHHLLEHAARQYRFFLQDHPNDSGAQGAKLGLAGIVELLHAQFLTSHRAGEGSSAAFVESTARVKRWVTLAAVFMCLGVLALAVYIFGPF